MGAILIGGRDHYARTRQRMPGEHARIIKNDGTIAGDARPAAGAGAAAAAATIIAAGASVASRHAARAKAALCDALGVGRQEARVLQWIERMARGRPARVCVRVAPETRSVVDAAGESRLTIAVLGAVGVRWPALSPLGADQRGAAVRVRGALRPVAASGTVLSAIDPRLIAVPHSVGAMAWAGTRSGARAVLTNICLCTGIAVVAGSTIGLRGERAPAAYSTAKRARSTAKCRIAGRTAGIDADVR